MATSIKLFSMAIIALFVIGALFLAGCPQTPPSPAPVTPPIKGTLVAPPTPVVNATPNATQNANETSPDLPAGNETATINESVNESAQIPTETNVSEEPKPPERTIMSNVFPDPLNGRMRSKICSIELNPTRIYSGQEVSVKIYAHSANNERVTFLCGDEERTQGQGGIFQDQRQCAFKGATGTKRVWLALDGQICASAPLEIIEHTVFPKPITPTCGIIPGSEASGFVDGLRTYQAKLELYGYSTASNLSWECPPEKFVRPLSDFTSDDYATGYLVVSCQYDYDPGQILSIPIRIDGNNCGDVIPAAG